MRMNFFVRAVALTLIPCFLQEPLYAIGEFQRAGAIVDTQSSILYATEALSPLSTETPHELNEHATAILYGRLGAGILTIASPRSAFAIL
jgi:hypothetical protein